MRALLRKSDPVTCDDLPAIVELLLAGRAPAPMRFHVASCPECFQLTRRFHGDALPWCEQLAHLPLALLKCGRVDPVRVLGKDLDDLPAVRWRISGLARHEAEAIVGHAEDSACALCASWLPQILNGWAPTGRPPPRRRVPGSLARWALLPVACSLVGTLTLLWVGFFQESNPIPLGGTNSGASASTVTPSMFAPLDSDESNTARPLREAEPGLLKEIQALLDDVRAMLRDRLSERPSEDLAVAQTRGGKLWPRWPRLRCLDGRPRFEWWDPSPQARYLLHLERKAGPGHWSHVRTVEVSANHWRPEAESPLEPGSYRYVVERPLMPEDPLLPPGPGLRAPQVVFLVLDAAERARVVFLRAGLAARLPDPAWKRQALLACFLEREFLFEDARRCLLEAREAARGSPDAAASLRLLLAHLDRRIATYSCLPFPPESDR